MRDVHRLAKGTEELLNLSRNQLKIDRFANRMLSSQMTPV
jgi:hypothetical protein